MNLLDVTGNGKYLINLDLVRCIKIEAFGKKAEIKFVYGSGEESIFGVSSGRLAVLDDILHNLEVVAS
jgi:hypothetical protein